MSRRSGDDRGRAVWRRPAFLAAIAALAATGYLQGIWTDRWTSSPDVGAAAGRLGQIPVTVDGWQAYDLEPLTARILERAGIVGYVSRRFVERSTGDSATVLLVCGRPGPISLHTPDVCFPGAGMSQVTAPRGLAPRPGSLASAPRFQEAKFSKGDPADVPSYLTVRWAWNAGGGWATPTAPRLAFASAPALYKLYVVHESKALDSPPGGDDPGIRLLEALLPSLERLGLPAATPL